MMIQQDEKPHVLPLTPPDEAPRHPDEMLRRLLRLYDAAEWGVTNRMLRAVCRWLIVTQVVVWVTAIGTAIGAVFRESFPWSGTVVGLIVGWPLAQLYVFYLQRKRI